MIPLSIFKMKQLSFDDASICCVFEILLAPFVERLCVSKVIVLSFIFGLISVQ